LKYVLLLALAACGDNASQACTIDGPMCGRLSSWNLDGAVSYTVNTPLFSDYTTKDRAILLPAGEAAAWADVDAFDLPVGSILIKTFGYLHDRRDPTQGEQLLETRLLIHGTAGWHGAAYVYNAAGTDANLAEAGATVHASWIHDDGTMRTNDYVVPNSNQCKTCHGEHDEVSTPLGIKARHLNDGEQLQGFVDAGMVTGAPPRAMWPHIPDAFDPNAGTLDERARGWLDINCGHCHNPRGLARTTGLFLDITETDATTLGICKPPVAAGPATGSLQFDVVPGDPDSSILAVRIASTQPAVKMPQLGRNLVEDEAVALIREWITALPGACH
jgi:uncharacterized repeat protein (TIGR03806 family)